MFHRGRRIDAYAVWEPYLTRGDQVGGKLQIDDALLASMDSQTVFLFSVGFLRSAPKARTYVEPRFLREEAGRPRRFFMPGPQEGKN